MVGFSVEWKARTYKKAETELVGATCRKFAESAQGSLTMGDFSFRFLKLKINEYLADHKKPVKYSVKSFFTIISHSKLALLWSGYVMHTFCTLIYVPEKQ